MVQEDREYTYIVNLITECYGFQDQDMINNNFNF